MDKLREIWRKNYELLTYVMVGMLTTLVDYAIYYPLFFFTGISVLCKTVSWCGAVVFSFFANKLFVFRQKDWAAKTVMGELFRFGSTRVGSVLLELIILYVTVDALRFNGYVMPLITGILVTVLNFLTTKYIAFRKNKK